MNDYGEETWEEYRQRILEETERFIEWGLRNPEQVNWIPTKPVGRGSFPIKVAEWFYQVVFLSPEEGRISAWRRRLRLGGRLR